MNQFITKRFDPQFTAVTGLNGSGKSNIIDSICFVLGITNLTNVRVTSLQDLIYKSGQAGINKATATITFDNTDKSQTPPGFEQYNEIVITRQIIIGGKNKYLLNGLNVTNKRIQDLFCSVQLNVNNPHFLIMQGKITKVLNMKPPEILAMVEEAAGTRMYEVKKQIASKNLEKKNIHLKELETLFYEDVEPTITKLHEERAKVFELQKLESELAHNMKLLEAWEFYVVEVKTQNGEATIKAIQKNIQNIKNTIQENLSNIKTLEEEAENILKQSNDLYSVVVDNDIVSKKLIERGNLQHRTTFIPLNKIRANRMSQDVVRLAHNLVGKENVTPALDVINYDKRLQPAMESIFGNVFITKDLNVAKKICFHDGIKKKCVTLEGDVVDPAGTLSGGSMQRNSSILTLLEEIKRQETQYQEKEKEYRKIQAEMQSMMHSRDQWASHTNQMELVQHQISVISRRLEQTTHHMQVAEAEQLKTDVGRLTEKLKAGEQKRKETQRIIKDLESKMKDSVGHQEKQRKEIENELKSLRKKAEKSKQQWMQREEDYRTITAEIEELKKTIQNTIEEIKTAQENIVDLKEKHKESNAETVKINNIVKDLKEAIQAEKSGIAAKNKNVQQKYKAKDKLIEQNNENDLEIKKVEYELSKAQDEYKMVKARFTELSRKCKNSNLIDEARKLNEAEGKALETKVRQQAQRRSELSKTVNMKAHQLFEHQTRVYENLKTKIADVQKDQAKIKDSIKKLDKAKLDLINKAFNQVTKDLGSILGTLLPGANARLKIPDGKTILEGLEIKVALGGVWKDSLDELSGGQRSLVALSLILAMLLFKPAPLYILDEVDAALDLSHTQNIGAMLKQHFKQSQFIIISLKDGMFSNANVLFKTQFIDGVSTVSRTSNL
ncbi:putative Structural maintenance of chromosomes protein [Trypoxylus dichotomus]